MRSLLFVPADSERKIEKGLASGADALILDLEDSVAAAGKQAAREIAAKALGERRTGSADPVLYVRINELDCGLAEDDLRAVIAGRPEGIMLPKCVGLSDVERLATMLRVAEAENGIADGATRILPIVTESARALLAAASFERPHPRLAGLTWGSEDLSADIGAAATRDEQGLPTDVFRLARTSCLLAATAVGTAPVDGVFVDFRDEAGLFAECRAALRDGFTAKLAIHPAQVAPINMAFTPDPELVAEAEALVAAFAAAGDPGVLGIGGKMYDRPHLRRAERLIARAQSGRSG